MPPENTSEYTERQAQLLAALNEIEADGGIGATAAELAMRAGVPGNDRRGNGAVKGSWSGYTAPAFAAAPSLTALVKRGVLECRSDDRGRYVYSRPEAPDA